MKQFIFFFFLLIDLITVAQTTELLATYSNSTNSKVSKWKFLFNNNIEIIDTTLNVNTDYKIISFNTSFVSGERLIMNHSKKGKIQFKNKRNALKFSTNGLFFINSVRAVNKLSHDTIRLNSFLISFSGKSKTASKITFNTTVFLENPINRIHLDSLLNLDYVPIIGEKLELVSYSIVCNASLILVNNSNTLPQELKDLISRNELRAPMEILFKDILIKDENGNLFEVPMRKFTLTKMKS